MIMGAISMFFFLPHTVSRIHRYVVRFSDLIGRVRSPTEARTCTCAAWLLRSPRSPRSTTSLGIDCHSRTRIRRSYTRTPHHENEAAPRMFPCGSAAGSPHRHIVTNPTRQGKPNKGICVVRTPRVQHIAACTF